MPLVLTLNISREKDSISSFDNLFQFMKRPSHYEIFPLCSYLQYKFSRVIKSLLILFIFRVKYVLLLHFRLYFSPRLWDPKERTAEISTRFCSLALEAVYAMYSENDLSTSATLKAAGLRSPCKGLFRWPTSISKLWTPIFPLALCCVWWIMFSCIISHKVGTAHVAQTIVRIKWVRISTELRNMPGT